MDEPLPCNHLAKSDADLCDVGNAITDWLEQCMVEISILVIIVALVGLEMYNSTSNKRIFQALIFIITNNWHGMSSSAYIFAFFHLANKIY